MRHKAITAAAPLPIASDKPLIPESELERTKRTEKNYVLPEEERLALIAKHGAPTRPHKAFEGQGVFKIPQRRPGA